jgi:hypothetical protein
MKTDNQITTLAARQSRRFSPVSKILTTDISHVKGGLVILQVGARGRVDDEQKEAINQMHLPSSSSH